MMGLLLSAIVDLCNTDFFIRHQKEAFCVALAEAMYCGNPAVIFTIHGSGINLVSLNGETGIEMPDGDYKAQY